MDNTAALYCLFFFPADCEVKTGYLIIY